MHAPPHDWAAVDKAERPPARRGCSRLGSSTAAARSAAARCSEDLTLRVCPLLRNTCLIAGFRCWLTFAQRAARIEHRATVQTQFAAFSMQKGTRYIYILHTRRRLAGTTGGWGDKGVPSVLNLACTCIHEEFLKHYLLSRIALWPIRTIEPRETVGKERMANAQLLEYGSKHVEQNLPNRMV